VSDVRQRLREATAPYHHALDHHPLLQRLVRKGLTVEEYVSSLVAMHAAHAGLERCVLQSEWHERSGLQLQPRCHLLCNDIVALGWEPFDFADTWFRWARSESEWLGQAYVLEGSRQGSAVIVKRVVESLGKTIPRQFLSESAERDVWPRLLSKMETRLNMSREVAIATDAAQAVFEDYSRAIDSVMEGVGFSHLACRE